MIEGHDFRIEKGFAQKAKIPLTAVSGSFRSFLLEGAPGFLRILPTEVGGWFRSLSTFAFTKNTGADKSVLRLGRKDLNNPPTSVGGICE